MTDITEIKRELEALTAKVTKLEAERTAPRRNWPEKVDAGMVFRHKRGKVCILTKANDLVWLSAPDDDAVHGGTYGPAKQGFGGKEDCFTYLGHARDILTIRTDAHEPTGAELVGKVCEFSDDDFVSYVTGKYECHAIGVRGYMTQFGVWWKYARLAQ